MCPPYLDDLSSRDLEQGLLSGAAEGAYGTVSERPAAPRDTTFIR